MQPVTYRYPLFRYFTLFSILIVIDMLVSIFLWLGKMHEAKIESSEKHYGMVNSVFDIACISVGRCIVLIPILALLESTTISSSQRGVNNGVKRVFLKLLSFIIVAGGLGFTIYKGVKVLEDKDNKSLEKSMTDTDYALCISSFVFSLFYFPLLLGYFKHLTIMHGHYVSMEKNLEDGDLEEGVDKSGEKPKKKKVNLKRMAALLKPVRIISL